MFNSTETKTNANGTYTIESWVVGPHTLKAITTEGQEGTSWRIENDRTQTDVQLNLREEYTKDFQVKGYYLTANWPSIGETNMATARKFASEMLNATIAAEELQAVLDSRQAK